MADVQLSEDEQRRREREEMAVGAILLRTEKKTWKNVHRVVRDATAQVAYDVALAQERDRERRDAYREAAVLAVVLARGAQLEQRLRREFLEGRAEARKQADMLYRARVQQAAELDAAYRRAIQAVDQMRAQGCANAVSDAWKRATASTSAKPSTKAFENARKTLGPQIEMNVATETCHAFNDQFVRVDQATRDRLDEAGVKPDWTWRWSAVMDRVTCPRCRVLDGKEFDTMSPDAVEKHPPIHKRCRCFLFFVRGGRGRSLVDLYRRSDMTINVPLRTPRRQLPLGPDEALLKR